MSARSPAAFADRRRAFYGALLLAPPLLWLGIVYLGSLFTLLLQSFYAIDEFTARVVPKFTLETYRQLVAHPANVDIIVRTLLMAVAVTIASALVAFPIANYMARHAGPRMKAFFYVGVMLPMWTSYLVKVYAWRLILAKQGIASWALDGRRPRRRARRGCSAFPSIGGPSLASSYLGMFIVFVYMWLPFMILPLAAALERVPASLVQASADLGATPRQTFRHVVVPLALPGLAAGSIFTFSLTLGDYIIPSVVGAPGYFIGMMVYQQQGTAGNMPLAAAFSIVPIVLIGSVPRARQAARSVRCALTRTGHARRSLQKLAAAAGLAFLHVPVLVIVLYAFTTEDRTYQFPPPGFTLHWFSAAFARDDIWAAMRLSLAVACVATALALLLGTLAAFALAKREFPRQGGDHAAVRAADRAARHRDGHRAAGRHQDARLRAQLLDHRRRARDVLPRDRLQQRRRAAAPAAQQLGRGLDGPRREQPADLPLRAAAADRHGAARGRHAGLRAVVRRDHRHAVHRRVTSARCRSGSTTSSSVRAIGRSPTSSRSS